MATKSVWRGSKDILEQPNSPKWKLSVNGDQCVRVYKGPYAKLLAARPAKYSTFPDVSGLYVTDIEIEHGPAGTGVMTVTLATIQTDSGGTPPEDVPETRYEIEWAQIERKLEQHPIFNSGGRYSLASTDLDKIEEWRSKASAADRLTAYNACSANAKEFIDRIQRGQDTYLVFNPIARRTKYFKNRTDAKNAISSAYGCGTISTPPTQCSITGYIYLQTAARLSNQGRFWELIEEWTGAEVWDSEVYTKPYT